MLAGFMFYPKNMKCTINYKEIIYAKPEKTISYGMTKVQALFCDLINLVPLLQMKLVYLVI